MILSILSKSQTNQFEYMINEKSTLQEIPVYSDLNVITAFAKEKTGVFEAEGFFDGSIIIHINEKYLGINKSMQSKKNLQDIPTPITDNDCSIKSKVNLQEHSGPITDLMFIVTSNYGVKIQEDTPTSSRLFFASSSYDQTIIIWQLYNGNWSVANTFEFEDSYCTSISADLNNEKIYFAFSDGDVSYIDINDATKMINIRKFNNAPICIAIYVNRLSVFSENNESEMIIIGNNSGEIQCIADESTQILKQDQRNTSRILYIDIDPPYILSTFEDGSVTITNNNLSKTNQITPALVKLHAFKPVMAKFDQLTHAIKILSDKGQIVTVMKLPNESYKII